MFRCSMVLSVGWLVGWMMLCDGRNWNSNVNFNVKFDNSR